MTLGMNKISKERLAVVVVGAVFIGTDLLAPTWTIRRFEGPTTTGSYWLWAPPTSDRFEDTHINWASTLGPVAGTALAVAFLCWFVGVGRTREAVQQAEVAVAAPRRS